jgi:RNA polymerase sigma-70 factor (ECF subfamily)
MEVSRESGTSVPDAATAGAPFAICNAGVFDAWVAPHLPVLRAVAVREVGAVDAEDLVQDTLVRAWRRRSTFDSQRGSPKTWLVAILMNLARRGRLRARAHDRVRDQVMPDPGGPDTTTGGVRLDVEAAVRGLPRRQREVVTLFYLADLSLSEVATALHIAEGSVKAHLSAARAALRNRLELI